MKAIICDRCHRVEEGVNHSQIMKRLRHLGWVRGNATGSYLCPACSGLPVPSGRDRAQRKQNAVRRGGFIELCCMLIDIVEHSGDIPEFSRGKLPRQMERVYKNCARVLDFLEVHDAKKDISRGLLAHYMDVVDRINAILSPLERDGLSRAASTIATVNMVCWLFLQFGFHVPEIGGKRCVMLLQQTTETLERYMTLAVERTQETSPAYGQAERGEILGSDLFLKIEPMFALA